MNQILSEFQSGTMTVVYLQNEAGGCGMTLFPTERRGALCLKQMPFEPLAHLFLTGDIYPTGFSNGVSMRRSTTSNSLVFQSQTHNPVTRTVETVLSNCTGIVVRHLCRLFNNVVECSCTVENQSTSPVTVELLTSFALNTAVFGAIRNESTLLHRLRSAWSSENRLLTQSLTQLNLDESWSGTGLRTLRYGVTGSLPSNGYAPFGALENTEAGVTWAALLEAPCSWQIEVARYLNEELCLSGGMGDFELAQYRKTLSPGQNLTTPAALLTVQVGNVEDCFRYLTRRISQRMEYLPDSEQELPVIYNEFCYTWGNPSSEKIKAAADKICGWGIDYFVIDAGWYQTEDGNWENNMGDWEVSHQLFPNGMREVTEYLRACGMIPGIWFELDNIADYSNAAKSCREQLLTRNGHIIQSGKRMFWNFALQEVTDNLDRKIIHFMQENGFSYIKIDCNESIGIGCDNQDSLGAGLRQNLAFSQAYYRRLHQEVPDLVLEVCASGGHRNEPSFLALSSMNSFSDAHECSSIPLIAANVGWIVPARQNQIWCVLRAADDQDRMEYSLAATFMGRMCLSGDLCALAPWQDMLIREAINFYDRIRPLIREGDQYLHRCCGDSYVQPTGSQIVIRQGERAMLLVAHAMENPVSMQLPVPAGGRVEARFGCDMLQFSDDLITFSPDKSFQAGALLLTWDKP